MIEPSANGRYRLTSGLRGHFDGSLLDGAITKAKRSGMRLRSVYGDRGFGTSTADAALARHGIRDVVIPRQQRAGPREHLDPPEHVDFLIPLHSKGRGKI